MFKIREITGFIPEKGYKAEIDFACLDHALEHAENKQRYLNTTLEVITPSGNIWYYKTRKNEGWKKLD